MTLCDIRFLRQELEEYRLLTEVLRQSKSWRSAALCRKLEHTVDQLSQKLWQVTTLIEEIPDPELRLIFELRYFRGFTWQQVANGLPTRLSADGARMKHDRYLQKLIPE